MNHKRQVVHLGAIWGGEKTILVVNMLVRRFHVHV